MLRCWHAQTISVVEMKERGMRSQSPYRPGSPRAWDAAEYDSCGTFVWEHGADLVEMLAPRSCDRFLDVGCGTGHLTARIDESGADVLGIDGSKSMVRQARSNYPHLCFEVVDALEMKLGPQFDAVFSNAVLHWITEPDVAASEIFNALKPGGRFGSGARRKGQHQRHHRSGPPRPREDKSPADRPEPWYFPDAGEYAALLEHLGFKVSYAGSLIAPHGWVKADGTMMTWLKTFGEPLLNDLTESQRDTVCGIAEDALRATMLDDGAWIADYVRLQVMAEKPPRSRDAGSS